MTPKLHTNKIIDNSPVLGEGSESLEDKTFRCRQELIMAGMTRYGLSKFNTKYLPQVIHDNEHIMAVVYGRYSEGFGILRWTDRMIVATDRRVISLNHKPGYTDIDEFTYDVIDGVESLTAGFFTGIILNTKIDSLNVRYVNRICAEKFVHYIEKRRIEYYQGSQRTR